MITSVNPYLNFARNAREAFEFYRSIFGGEFEMTLLYRDFPGAMGVPESEQDKIAHIALPVGPNMLMGTDVIGDSLAAFKLGTNSYVVVTPDDAAEARRLFDGLSAGGTVEMPLQATEWAEQYGICTDRFGVQWMVNYEGKNKFGG